jgi:hypothetical protein
MVPSSSLCPGGAEGCSHGWSGDESSRRSATRGKKTLQISLPSFPSRPAGREGNEAENNKNNTFTPHGFRGCAAPPVATALRPSGAKSKSAQATKTVSQVAPGCHGRLARSEPPRGDSRREWPTVESPRGALKTRQKKNGPVASVPGLRGFAASSWATA